MNRDKILAFPSGIAIQPTFIVVAVNLRNLVLLKPWPSFIRGFCDSIIIKSIHLPRRNFAISYWGIHLSVHCIKNVNFKIYRKGYLKIREKLGCEGEGGRVMTSGKYLIG